jgi:ActR/RegA family two-component response regulator
MADPAIRTRILFVDDEAGIRLTLSAILQQNEFEVTSVATVAEALREINSQQFDALISDLNIGEAGDGFTVVSAMRRTQPKCVNFILTGYPAFETALQAIRNKVDDYLVKPANIQELVRSLKSKLNSPRELRIVLAQPMANFLGEHQADIQGRLLAEMKSHPRLATLPLSDEQRTDHIPDFLKEIVRFLDCESADDCMDGILAAGAKHGVTRRKQGYSQEMLVDDVQLIDKSIYNAVQDNLLKVELSSLIPALRQVNSAITNYLLESLKAFQQKRAA